MDEQDGVQSGRRGRPVQDLTGRIFGHLLPVEFKRDKERRVSMWLCGCTSLGIGCVGHTGELKQVAATSLVNHRQFTCGCRKEYNLQQKNLGPTAQGHREERAATEGDYAKANISKYCPEHLVPTLEDLGIPDLTDVPLSEL